MDEPGREQVAVQLAICDERERIARGLYDRVVHRLFASAMDLEGTLAEIAADHARQRIERVVAELDDVVRDLRAVVFDREATDTMLHAHEGDLVAREPLSSA